MSRGTQAEATRQDGDAHLEWMRGANVRLAQLLQGIDLELGRAHELDGELHRTMVSIWETTAQIELFNEERRRRSARSQRTLRVW